MLLPPSTTTNLPPGRAQTRSAVFRPAGFRRVPHPWFPKGGSWVSFNHKPQRDSLPPPRLPLPLKLRRLPRPPLALQIIEILQLQPGCTGASNLPFFLLGVLTLQPPPNADRP